VDSRRSSGVVTVAAGQQATHAPPNQVPRNAVREAGMATFVESVASPRQVYDCEQHPSPLPAPVPSRTAPNNAPDSENPQDVGGTAIAIERPRRPRS
jgi:hypothetical protein